MAESFNDGVVKIYKTENSSEPGRMPTEAETPKAKLRFGDRTVGNQRHFLALQAGVKVSRLVRCPYRTEVSALDVASVQDFSDGKINCYKIKLVQYPEKVFPRVMDLTLSLIERSSKNV